MTEKVCKSCSAPLPASKGGRPADYCSNACRRLSEYEIKRVARRLEGLEARLSEVRLGPYGNAWPLALEDKHKEVIAALQAEIALQTGRLRELLAQ